MKRLIVSLTCITLLLILVGGSLQSTRADTLVPVSGSTSGPILWGSVGNVIDGNVNFESYIGFGAYSSGSNNIGPLSGAPFSLRFNLPSGNWSLTGMNLWNNAGYIQGDKEGINSFTLNFFNSSLSPLGSYNGNATDTLAPQLISFGPTASNVSAVDLVINSSWGKTYVAFHEVNFIGTAVREVIEQPSVVPEPTTMLLLGSGLIGLAGYGRKKFFKK